MVEARVAQNPVFRDPQMFNHSEVAMGPASREMTYKIQKWNVCLRQVAPYLSGKCESRLACLEG